MLWNMPKRVRMLEQKVAELAEQQADFERRLPSEAPPPGVIKISPGIMEELAGWVETNHPDAAAIARRYPTKIVVFHADEATKLIVAITSPDVDGGDALKWRHWRRVVRELIAFGGEASDAVKARAAVP